jgi:membrane protein DedA with SNARE-associated domain
VLVAGVTSTLTSLIGDHGVYAVFLLMAIDAVFPAASELVMVYAGALAAGAFSGQSVVLFGTHVDSHFWGFVVMSLSGAIGYLVGAIAGWAIGLYGGRPLLERHGRWFHLSGDKLERAERWFDRWGDWAVLIGRVTPVARSFISIPAGVFRMPLGRYVVLTAIGSTIWAFVFAGAGWAAGANYEHFDHGFRYVEYAILALILAGAAYWVLKRRQLTQSRERAEERLRP